MLVNLMLTNCNSASNITLEKNKWKLVELNEDKNEVFSNKDAFTLDFSSIEEAKLSGIGACNRFFGTFKTEQDSLNITMGGTTMMACPNLSYETTYFQALEKVETYDIKGNTLSLYSNGKIVAKFKHTSL